LELTLTPEQEYFWNQLKFDAQYFAHICGKDMQGKSENRVNKEAQGYLDLAMTHLSTEDLTGVVKTWLNYYQLPLNPNKLGNVFDKFHETYGTYVTKNAKNIKMIGCH
jgi:hypothetical protein